MLPSVLGSRVTRRAGGGGAFERFRADRLARSDRPSRRGYISISVRTQIVFALNPAKTPRADFRPLNDAGSRAAFIHDVLHVGVKRDPTNFSTPAMRVTL